MEEITNASLLFALLKARQDRQGSLLISALFIWIIHRTTDRFLIEDVSLQEFFREKFLLVFVAERGNKKTKRKTPFRKKEREFFSLMHVSVLIRLAADCLDANR